MSNIFEVGQRVSYPNRVHDKTMYATVTEIAPWEEEGGQVVFIEREDIPGSESFSVRSSGLTPEPSLADLEAERLMEEEALEWNGSLVTEGGMYGGPCYQDDRETLEKLRVKDFEWDPETMVMMDDMIDSQNTALAAALGIKKEML